MPQLPFISTAVVVILQSEDNFLESLPVTFSIHPSCFSMIKFTVAEINMARKLLRKGE